MLWGSFKKWGCCTCSKITSSSSIVGIEIDSDGLNKSEIINTGKIEFNDEIKVDSADGIIYGIYLQRKQSVLTNYGKIIFSKISKFFNRIWSFGILNFDADTNKIINKSTGLIAFNGELPSGDEKLWYWRIN